MQGKGPKYERETVIRFDEESSTAEVWTASEVVYRRMLKRGWYPNADSERTASFIVPKTAVKLPLNRAGKPKRKATGFVAKLPNKLQNVL